MQFTYALFINLDTNLEAKVTAIKQQFADTFNSTSPVTRPHITVASNQLDKGDEHGLIEELEKIARTTHPFKIELSNYDKFKRIDNNTIYIALTDNKLQGFNLAANKAFGKKSQALHVTISRGLTDVVFNRAWPKYINAKFAGTCIINEAVLTRVENGKYKTVRTFKFNLQAPDKTQQTELF